MLSEHNRGRALLENPSLFARDRLERAAKHACVLQIDEGNARSEGALDDVGAVQTTAHSNLQNDDIDILLQEERERH